MKLYDLKYKIKYDEFFRLKNYLFNLKNNKNQKYDYNKFKQFTQILKNILITDIKYIKYTNGYLNNTFAFNTNNFLKGLKCIESNIQQFILKNPNQFLKLNCILKVISFNDNICVFQILYYVNSKKKQVILFGNFIKLDLNILANAFISGYFYFATKNHINFYNDVQKKLTFFK